MRRGPSFTIMSRIFLASVTIAVAILALLVTLTAIAGQALPVLTRGALIVMAVLLWFFTIYWLTIWRRFKVVLLWKREQEELNRKGERVNTYFAKVDAGELPDGPLPPEIRQDLQDILADWRRELLRQEGLEPPPMQR